MERIRHPEILPLEVWDLLVGGTILGERIYTPEAPAALREALVTLHAGRGATRSGGPLPAVVAGFAAVFLTGGRAREEELRVDLSGLPFAVVFGAEDVFAAVRGGFELLQSLALPGGWVLDLGQSQLKLATPERRWTFPRDSTRLRAAGEVSPAELPAHRRRLREFIALKLQFAMAEIRQRPRALVFAFPTRVDSDGTPQGGSYAGLRNDRTLLPDALELAGLAGLPLFVLNDAELAALGARSEARLAGFRKVLVLTLGFGIGAALIQRSG